MPRLPFRIAMFLSSFSPLLAVMAYENHTYTVALIVLLAACLTGIVGLFFVMRQLTDETGPRIEVRDCAPRDGEVLAYIAVYLVPFLGVDLGKRHAAMAFCVFMAVLGIVYVNSNMLFVNPLLTIAGYHSFEITDKNGHIFSLIVRLRGVEGRTTIRPAQVDRYLRVDARWRPRAVDEPKRDP